MERETNYGIKGCLLVVGMMIVSVFMCIFLIYVSVDISCVNNAGKWMIDYPGAELIEETYSGIRPFGIGFTQRTIYTTDDLNDVRSWYLANDRQLNDGGEAITGGMGRMGRSYRAAPGGGTNIELSQECSSVMVPW
jgi:hypothetical protein